MYAKLEKTETKELFNAKIQQLMKKELPLKKDGWQFNWKQLYKTEEANFYKITLLETPDNLQGSLMISLMFDEMVYMNNIEVAPKNLGKNKEYDLVAASLIAYACWLGFELGQNAYTGFLSFESKTELVELYQNKYGATIISGQRMFIAPEVGLQLINKYLFEKIK